MNNQKNTLGPFIAVTSLFFIWGFITVFVDALVPRIRDMFEMTYRQSSTLQTAFFGAYGLLSIPAGIIISKIGYQRGILMGLGIMGMGCLLYSPAASQRIFGLFLVAFFIVAGGMTVLQVAANPYVSVLGSEETASSRLTLAQAFNSLGTMLAPMLSAALILSDNVLSPDAIKELGAEEKATYLTNEAAIVSKPFLYLGAVISVMFLAFVFMKLPKILSKSSGGQTNGFLQAMKFPQLRLGALAIFLYVGAEVAIGTFAVNYFAEMNLRDRAMEVPFLRSMVSFARFITGKSGDIALVDDKGILGTFITYYWGGAMIGRFIGSVLARKIKPALLLSIFGGGAILMLLLSIASTGLPAMYCLLAVGLFNSIMFPTIFTLGIDGLGDFKPQGSGVLCTAIVGGAAIPFLFGAIVDNSGFNAAFFLPILCYLYIAAYGFWFNNRKKAIPVTA